MEKKKEKMYACARSASSARVHLSYETSLELVSHKFPRKLVSEIRHFSHPRRLPLPPPPPLLLFSSMSRVPSASYTPPPSWCPFSTRNLLLTKDRPGISCHRRIERVALHFVSPFIHASPRALRPSYHDSSSPRPSSIFFFFISIPRKMPDSEKEESRRTRQENRPGAVCFFFSVPASSSALLSLSSCSLLSVRG